MLTVMQFPAWPWLVSVLSLTACSSGPEENSLGEQVTITGTATGWTGGEGYTVQVFMIQPGVKPNPLFTSSPLAADGSFSFRLPDANEVLPFLDTATWRVHQQPCSSVPTVTPPDVRVTGPYTKVAMGNHFPLQLDFSNYPDIGNAPAKYTNSQLMYSEQDAEVLGNLACSGNTVPATYELHLKRGWNWIFSHTTRYSPGSLDGLMVDYRTESTPSDCQWYAR